jgi:hypothetical protein
MKSQQSLSLVTIFLAMSLNILSINAEADGAHYVYTNDGQENNTVTGFEVAPDGSLTKIGQWSTGGIGCPHGFISATRAVASENAELLVSNGFGVGRQLTTGTCPSVAATISKFSIASDGNLSLVKVIPDPADPAQLTPGDTSVASVGNCLILGSTNGKKLISYKLPAITYVSTVSFEDNIIDMKINNVQRASYTAATLIDVNTGVYKNQIEVTPINSDTCELGLPTIIATSGVKVGPQGGGSAGLAFSPDGSKMYVGVANRSKGIIEAFNFPSGTPLAGSPYVYPSGNGSATVLVSRDGECLFMANQFYSTVTSIPLSSGVPGPFAKAYKVGSTAPLEIPIGLANDIDGNKLYVGIHPDNSVARDNAVITELIGTDCTLTEAPGGPVPTGVTSDIGLQTSIVAIGGD